MTSNEWILLAITGWFIGIPILLIIIMVLIRGWLND